MARYCISETELTEYNKRGQMRIIWLYTYNDGTEESVTGAWV